MSLSIAPGTVCEAGFILQMAWLFMSFVKNWFSFPPPNINKVSVLSYLSAFGPLQLLQ